MHSLFVQLIIIIITLFCNKEAQEILRQLNESFYILVHYCSKRLLVAKMPWWMRHTRSPRTRISEGKFLATNFRDLKSVLLIDFLNTCYLLLELLLFTIMVRNYKNLLNKTRTLKTDELFLKTTLQLSQKSKTSSIFIPKTNIDIFKHQALH